MKIDFVEPWRPSRTAWIATGGLWLVVLVLAALHGYLGSELKRQQETREAADARAHAQAAAPKPRLMPPYQEEALAAFRRAALPEAAAFTELERVAVVGIQLRSIDDDPSVSTVTVELDAASDAVLVDYVDQLNAGMPTPRWHIRQVSALQGPAGRADVHPDGSAPPQLMRGATIYREVPSSPVLDGPAGAPLASLAALPPSALPDGARQRIRYWPSPVRT
jgi:hypothetical protein